MISMQVEQAKIALFSSAHPSCFAAFVGLKHGWEELGADVLTAFPLPEERVQKSIFDNFSPNLVVSLHCGMDSFTIDGNEDISISMETKARYWWKDRAPSFQGLSYATLQPLGLPTHGTRGFLHAIHPHCVSSSSTPSCDVALHVDIPPASVLSKPVLKSFVLPERQQLGTIKRFLHELQIRPHTLLTELHTLRSSVEAYFRKHHCPHV